MSHFCHEHFAAHILFKPAAGGFLYTSFASLLERTLNDREGRVSVTAAPLSPRPPCNSLATRIRLAFVFDSMPSKSDWTIAIGLIGGNIKSPALKVAATVPATAFFVSLLGTYSVLRSPWPVAALHERLNSPNILPGASDSSTPRLYFYSEGDEIVDWKDVELHLRHLQDALRLNPSDVSFFGGNGVNHVVVTVEKFDRSSSHIKHVRTDPTRYWNAVLTVWEKVAGGERLSNRARQAKL